MGEDAGETLTACAYILAAQIIFGINEVLIKWTKIKVASLQLIVNSVHLTCLIFWWRHRRPSSSRSKWYGDSICDRIYIWSNGLLFSTIFMFYYAVERLPIGDLQCLFYQSPLWIIFCCWFFFGDRLPKWFILAPSTILTVVGVLFVSQPPFIFLLHGDPLPIDGVIAVFLSCIRWIGSVLIVKHSAGSVDFVQFQFGCTLCSLFISVPTMFVLNAFVIENESIGTIFDLLYIPWQHALTAVLIGFGQLNGMSLSVMAYQRGNGARISWLEYIAIPLAFGYQILIFDDDPNAFEVVGATMVVIGSLLPGIHQITTYLMEKKQSTLSLQEEYEEICDGVDV